MKVDIPVERLKLVIKINNATGKVQEIATRLSDGQIIDLEDITDGAWWAQAIDLTWEEEMMVTPIRNSISTEKRGSRL